MHWLIYLLVHWLNWLMHKLIDLLIVWSIDWFIDWLIDRQSFYQILIIFVFYVPINYRLDHYVNKLFVHPRGHRLKRPEENQSNHWIHEIIMVPRFSSTGAIHVYLTKLPILGDAAGTKIAYLTSLREVTVADEVNQERQMKVPTHIEPSFIAIGPYHLAIGMNNRAWFCAFTEDGPSQFRDREYLGTVSQLQVLFENHFMLITCDCCDSSDHDRMPNDLLWFVLHRCIWYKSHLVYELLAFCSLENYFLQCQDGDRLVSTLASRGSRSTTPFRRNSFRALSIIGHFWWQFFMIYSIL